MSSTFNSPPTSIPTSAQPALHVDNITAHPGSTFAGAGLIVATVGQAMLSQPMPTTITGWAAWALPIVLGGLGMFGK
jgi:hypothetical protein